MKATAGLVGYYAGPDTHVVDPLGLTDPLLARLPAEFNPDWRTGHFRRHVPPGYIQAAGTDEVELPEPDAQALHDALAVVVRGALLAPERWRAIVALNSGAFPVDPDPWRYPSLDHPLRVEGRIRGGGAVFAAGGDEAVVQLAAPRATTSSPPWTVRADDGREPLRTWTLPAGEHRLPLPRGTRRLLFLPRKPADLDGCSACTPLPDAG